jgi:vitamin B12 transporter
MPIFPAFSRSSLHGAVVASLALAIATPLTADEGPAGDLPASDLPEIVVTASRVAETADSTLAAVTVIDRAAIERSQAADLPELIRRATGVGIANAGGAGKVTDLFLRGANPGHTLVLIDGVRIGSATLGGAALQELPLALIERVEIVRGPRSALYGSEAIGGVIQVFTRKGGGATRLSAGLEGGGNDTYRAEAQASGGGADLWWSLGASDTDTQGFDASSSGLEPDDDGYHNRAFHLRAGGRWGGGNALDLNALRAAGENDYDNPWDPRAETAETLTQTLGARLTLAPREDLELVLALGESRDEYEDFADGAASGYFDTRRRSASVQADLTFTSEQALTLGLERVEDRVSSSNAYVEDTRRDDALFAQYRLSAGRHDWQAALRRDDDSQFGGATTGNLAWGMALDGGLRLTAAYGTAFKAPTFNQLYWPNAGWGGGNPDLDPERSKTAEAGLRGQGGGFDWSATLFENRIEEMIAGWPPENVNQARIRGLEGELACVLAAWQVRANATLQDPESRSGATGGNQLPRRARQMFNLELARDLGPWGLGATLHAEGRRYDDLANHKPLAGFATLDLRLGYALDAEWRIEAKAANLLDADYQTADGYRQPGREFSLGIRYQTR